MLNYLSLSVTPTDIAHCQIFSKKKKKKDTKYLKAAEDAAEHIWKFGMLRKGVGLCHGMSQTLLAAFPLSRSLSVCLSACLPVCLPVCLSVCLPLSVCLFSSLPQV